MPPSDKKKTVVAVLAVLVAFFAGGSLVPNFLKPANFLNVVRQCSIIVVCAVGIAPVIISRGIDLSVGGNVTFCGMLTGFLLLRGVPVVLAIFIGLIAGALIGSVSGLLYAYLEVPAFIATLVMGQITQGSAFLLNNGRSFGGFPASYVFIGNGAFLGIPISNYIMVVFVALGVFLMKKMPVGLHIYGLGGNEAVLKNAGINTLQLKWFVYILSGFCAAAAGIVLASQLDTAHPTQGEPYQLDAIASCIIGGVSMSGGEGNIIFVMVGALIIGSIRNILNLLAVHSFYQNILVGIIIIAVVAVSMAARQRRASKTVQFAMTKAS